MDHCNTCRRRYRCDAMTTYDCMSNNYRYYDQDSILLLQEVDNMFKKNKEKKRRREFMVGCATCLNRAICDSKEKEYCLIHEFEGYDEDYSVIYELEAEGTPCEGCKHLAFRYPYPAMYPCNCCSRAHPKDYYERLILCVNMKNVRIGTAHTIKIMMIV